MQKVYRLLENGDRSWEVWIGYRVEFPQPIGVVIVYQRPRRRDADVVHNEITWCEESWFLDPETAVKSHTDQMSANNAAVAERMMAAIANSGVL